MTTTLDSILASTRHAVSALERRRPELERAAHATAAPPPWSAAFTGQALSVIAEVKRRSPSAGPIAPVVDAARQARSYERGGARAISVVTEAIHFGGTVADLERVRSATDLPLLRKDFMLEPVQVYEARAAGASAVLLIVRALDAARLGDLVTLARELGLGQLIEVHDARELDRALALEPETVGVNSRDLATLEVRPEVLRTVLPLVPPGVVAVAESGLAHRADVERVARWGADAVLVGTALSRAADPAVAVGALVGVPRLGR